MNFMVTWLIRREGEFRCPRCGGISNIILDAKLSILGVVAVFTTLILFFVYRYVKNDERPEMLLWLLLPIVLFYLLKTDLKGLFLFLPVALLLLIVLGG